MVNFIREFKNTGPDFFRCYNRPVIYVEIHKRQWTKHSAERWKPIGWYSSYWVGWVLMGAVWPFCLTGERWGRLRWSSGLSALHPKVLCELLDLQQIFSVDCRTGGGQRAQHVWLQRKRFKSVLSLFFYIKMFLHPVYRLTDVHVHFNSKDVYAAEAKVGKTGETKY